MKTVIFFILSGVIFSFVLLLQGCGQSGPLYLPAANDEGQPAVAETTHPNQQYPQNNAKIKRSEHLESF